MANLLISGPAGASKSEVAREIVQAATEPTIVADFTALFNAVRLVERLPDGTFPVRTEADNVYLPIAEAMRLESIAQARRRGLQVVTTNSDGSPERRRFLLERLGPGSIEQVVDPGEQVCRARLSGRTGQLSRACEGAIRRWYAGARRR